MERPRHEKRLTRWGDLTGADRKLGVWGVVGKAFTVPGLMLAVFGASAGSGAGVAGVGVAGVVVAVAGFAAWRHAAQVIGAKVGLSTTQTMWTIWRVPTWSIPGEILDFLSIF